MPRRSAHPQACPNGCRHTKPMEFMGDLWFCFKCGDEWDASLIPETEEPDPMTPSPDSPANLPSGWQEWPTATLIILRLSHIRAEQYVTADAINEVVEARLNAERDSLAGHGLDEHGQLRPLNYAGIVDQATAERAGVVGDGLRPGGNRVLVGVHPERADDVENAERLLSALGHGGALTAGSLTIGPADLARLVRIIAAADAMADTIERFDGIRAETWLAPHETALVGACVRYREERGR